MSGSKNCVFQFIHSGRSYSSRIWREAKWYSGTYAICYPFCHHDYAGFFTKRSWHIHSLSHIRNIHWCWLRNLVLWFVIFCMLTTVTLLPSERELQLLMDCFSTICDVFELTVSRKQLSCCNLHQVKPCILPLIFVIGKVRNVDTCLAWQYLDPAHLKERTLIDS